MLTCVHHAAQNYFDLCFLAIGGLSVRGPPGEGWELVFHDEFNGRQLNWDAWLCEKGDRRNAYNDPDDSYLDGKGHLLLRVRKAEDGKYHLGLIRTRKLSSGVTTKRAPPGHRARLLERVLADGARRRTARTSTARRWTSGGPHRDDIVEHNIHQGEGPTHKHEGATVKFNGLRTDWHLFACDWHEQGFDFFVDGETSWTTRTMKASKPNWIYLTLESQFEGWAEDIRKFESQLPAYYVVDYVRYYRKNPQAPFIAATDNGKAIRVKLKNGKFAARLDPSKWSIENLPEGVIAERSEAHGRRSRGAEAEGEIEGGPDEFDGDRGGGRGGGFAVAVDCEPRPALTRLPRRPPAPRRHEGPDGFTRRPASPSRRRARRR